MRFFPSRQFHAPMGEPSQRQMIPGQPGRQQAMSMPQMGMNNPGMGSQGLFSQYMSQLFNQKYAPPMMQGSPLQSYGGFFGFGAPKLSPLQQRQQPQPGPGTNGTTWSDLYSNGTGGA
jgi:hypothetical protein